MVCDDHEIQELTGIYFYFFPLAPNMVLPTLTLVLPFGIACSKSADIPMLSSTCSVLSPISLHTLPLASTKHTKSGLAPEL